MAENTEKSKLQYIVADSAAFLKNVPLHDICENVYTVEEVVNEVRDAATRRRLSVLPYTLHFRQPSSEALHVGKRHESVSLIFLPSDYHLRMTVLLSESSENGKIPIQALQLLLPF